MFWRKPETEDGNTEDYDNTEVNTQLQTQPPLQVLLLKPTTNTSCAATTFLTTNLLLFIIILCSKGSGNLVPTLVFHKTKVMY